IKKRVLTKDGEISKQGFDLFSKVKTARIQNIPFRRLRKRLGTKHFLSFMGLLVDILEGRVDQGLSRAHGSDDKDLARDKFMIDRALGLFRARGSGHIPTNLQVYDDAEQAQ